MKGVEGFIARTLEACKNKEKIILLGDADLDGVASVIIFKEMFEILDNPVSVVYFPHLEKESYGLNEKALKFLANQAPAVLITLDCGISNTKEIEVAQKMGFTVIVIDHHQVLETLPEASIIINPWQKDDTYPFKELCAAGIVYNLARALLFEAQKSFEPERFLELSMLATLYDQVSLTDENEKIVEQGLLSLAYTKRIGLKVIMELTDCQFFDESEVREKIIPVLSAANSRNHQSEAYLLFNCASIKEAERIARRLLKKRKMKKERAYMLFETINQKIDPVSLIIFEGEEDWPTAVMGTVASRLCQQHKKPTFIFTKGKKESKGTVRTPEGIDAVKMMTFCSHLLESYGGHPQASGFRVKNENLEKFKKCLIENLNSTK